MRSEGIAYIVAGIFGLMAIAAVFGYRQGYENGEYDCRNNTKVMSATVIHVEEGPEWRDPRTLVEYEDGTRRIMTGFYGPAGDTFSLPK